MQMVSDVGCLSMYMRVCMYCMYLLQLAYLTSPDFWFSNQSDFDQDSPTTYDI